MTDAPLEPAGVSPLFQEREAAIEAVRDAMVRFGDRLGLFAAPNAEDVFGGDLPLLRGAEFRERATVEELLGTLREGWDPESVAEQEQADRSGRLAHALRRSLLDFGEVFRLYDYERSRGDNSRAHAETLPPRELVALIEEVWHEQAGCYSHLPAEADEFRVQRQIRSNRELLREFARAAGYSDAVVQRWGALRDGRWYREARHLADHGLNEWVADAERWPEVRAAMRRMRGCAERGTADPERRRLFLHAASDAVQALLLRAVVADPVLQALYEAFEPALPLAELQIRSPDQR